MSTSSSTQELERLFTADEVAAYLGTTTLSVKRLSKSGRLRVVYLNYCSPRYPQSAVSDYINSCQSVHDNTKRAERRAARKSK